MVYRRRSKWAFGGDPFTKLGYGIFEEYKVERKNGRACVDNNDL
jgi:hypothetical protein